MEESTETANGPQDQVCGCTQAGDQLIVAEAAGQPRMAASRIAVLIVDDEPAVREVCLRSLAAEGYDVQTASDTIEALDKLRNPYDVVLLDVRMPGVSGLELYAKIESAYPGILGGLAFMTGAVLDAETQLLLQQSGHVILSKPFTPTELKEVVLEVLKRARKP
jgi:CheY-like chemotaxis protein